MNKRNKRNLSEVLLHLIFHTTTFNNMESKIHLMHLSHSPPLTLTRLSQQTNLQPVFSPPFNEKIQFIYVSLNLALIPGLIEFY